MYSADFTCGKRSTIQSVLRELLLMVNLWVSNKNLKETICLFIVFCLFINNISWKHDRQHLSLITRITSSKTSANFMHFLLSSSATTEFCLKICVTSYSRQIVSDFLKVVCANGHAKMVFEVTTLRNRFSCGACLL